MKFCTHCEQDKSLDEFALNRAKPDGHQAWCKSCTKEVNADLYRNGYKEKQKAHNRRNKRRYMDELLEDVGDLLAAGCIVCGETDPACLDFHHRDPAQKAYGVRQAVHHGWSRTRVRAEAAKCDILCANCHRKHHAYGSVLPE
jgi:hypothetical protein